MHASSYFTIMIQRGGWSELWRVGGGGRETGKIKKKKKKKETMSMIDQNKKVSI